MRIFISFALLLFISYGAAEISGAGEGGENVVSRCVQQLTSLKMYLKKEATQAGVTSVLEGVCDRLGLDNAATCRNMARLYGPIYYDLLQGKLEAEAACLSLVQAYDTRAQHLVMEFVSQVTNTLNVQETITCLACEFVLQEADKLLKNNLTISELNATLHEVCKSLPKLAQRLECKAAIPVILKEAEKGFDPQKTCIKLELCANATLTKNGSVECNFCKYIVEELDNFLYNSKDEIHDYIDMLCHRLPPDTDQKCLGFVDPNFDKMLVKALNTTLSPQSVCGNITKICT